MKHSWTTSILAVVALFFAATCGRGEETIPIVAVTAGVRTDHDRGADFVLCLVVFPQEKRDSGIQVYSWGQPGQALPVPESGAYVSFNLPARFTVGLALLNPIEFEHLQDLRVLERPPSEPPQYARRFLNGPLVPPGDFSDGWGWPFSQYYRATAVVCKVEIAKVYESYGVKTISDEAEIVFEAPEELAGQKIAVLLGDSENARPITNEHLFRSARNRLAFVLPEDLMTRLKNDETDFCGLQDLFLITPAPPAHVERAVAQR